MPITISNGRAGALSPDAQSAFDLVVNVYRSFQNGAPEQIRAVQTVDTTVWDAFTPYLVTDTERKAFHSQDVKRSQTRGEQFLDFEPLQVEVTERMALVVCMIRFEFKPPRPISGELRITSVLYRPAGEWRMLHHHEAVPPKGWPDEV